MSVRNARRLPARGAPRGAHPAAALGGRLTGESANPHSETAAEHAGRSLSQSPGAGLMPIFDQGYQHWKGPLSSHAWRWLAITRHGVRIGLQGRVFRIMLLVALLPAVALATALCLWGLIERKSDLVAGLVPILVS